MFILREPHLLVSLNLFHKPLSSFKHYLHFLIILVICNLYNVLLRGSQMFLTPIETLLCARSWGVLSRTLRCLFRTIQTDQFLCACPSRLTLYKAFSCSRILNPDGYIGADHHFRRFNDTNLSPIFS
jgi:hypothetical protein